MIRELNILFHMMDRSSTTPWWQRFVRLLLFTLRERDAATVDPEELIRFARQLGADAIGVNAGGIAAFYPSTLTEHRRSPHLGERDFLGEVTREAHRQGLKVIGRIDPSLAEARLLEAHPDWFSRTRSGDPVEASGLYVTCPNGPYFQTVFLRIIRELLERHELDGLWCNGARFSAAEAGQCFCPNCQRAFRAEANAAVPAEDWDDPLYRRFVEWRYRALARWVQLAREEKDQLRPEIPWVVANQVIEPWEFIRSGGWDVDQWLDAVDVIAVEGQRRNVSPWWIAGEAKYLRALAPSKPRWITVSYFYPWWRLYAAPVAENRAWLAQTVANGACPWLHVNGHASDVFDRRGFPAVQDFYAFLGDARDHYDGATSRAEIALVFSRRTLDQYGRDHPEERYLDHFRGYYQALSDAGLDFDVLSDTLLADLGRYRVVVAPNLACLSDGGAAALRAYLGGGGGLVATFETGYYDPFGEPRPVPALDGLLGRSLGLRRDGLTSAYALVADSAHPLLAGLGDTDLLPLYGSVRYVEPPPGTAIPLTLVPPVRAHGGSDMSIPEHNVVDLRTSHPLAIVSNVGNGRAVYFPYGLDLMYQRFGLADLGVVLANAIRLAHGGQLDVEVHANGPLELSLMHQPGRQILHLINMAGGRSTRSAWRQPLERTIPLGPVEIRLRPPQHGAVRRVHTVRANRELPFELRDNSISVSLPALADYEILVFDHSR